MKCDDWEIDLQKGKAVFYKEEHEIGEISLDIILNEYMRFNDNTIYFDDIEEEAI